MAAEKPTPCTMRQTTNTASLELTAGTNVPASSSAAPPTITRNRPARSTSGPHTMRAAAAAAENTAASTPAKAALPPMCAMNTEVPELRPWPTMKQQSVPATTITNSGDHRRSRLRAPRRSCAPALQGAAPAPGDPMGAWLPPAPSASGLPNSAIPSSESYASGSSSAAAPSDI